MRLPVPSPVDTMESGGARERRGPSWLWSIVRSLLRTGARRPADLPRESDPIRLYAFDSRRHPNFGDRLNFDLLERLTGRRVKTADASTATHVCIGSLLQCFLRGRSAPARGGPPLAVWGTGFIAAPDSAGGREEFTRPLVVHAVRGHLTRERLRNLGEDVSGAALGDPGLLARCLVSGPAPAPRYRLGLVAHYVDERDPIFTRLLARIPSSRIIRVDAAPTRFLSELRECAVVLSSAMHGLIAADSLGIPNARIVVSDRIAGGDYKFRDYYSVFGVDPRPLSRVELASLTSADLARVESAYAIDAAVVDRVITALLASCPFTTTLGRASAA